MSLGITVCHHSTSLVMPNDDPQDGFLYATLTLMIDSYNITGKGSYNIPKNQGPSWPRILGRSDFSLQEN